MRSSEVSTPDRATGLNVPGWHVVAVHALRSHSLELVFADGTDGTVDLRQLIFGTRAGVFEALRDPDRFAQVRIEHGAVVWPGEIDLAPDALYAAIRSNQAFPIPDSESC